MTIRIEWHSRLEDIEALEIPWRALEAAVRQRTPLVSFDHLIPWYRHYRVSHGEPLLGAAWQGSDLIGIAPLVHHRKRLGRVPVAAIEFAGYDGESGEFLIADDRPDVLAPVLRSLSAARRFDALILGNMDAESPHVRCVAEAAAEAGLAVERGESVYAVADLEHGYEAYSAATGHELRKRLRKRSGRIEELGGLSLIGTHFERDPEQVAAWVQRTFDINDRSWKARNRGPLAEHHRAFYRELCDRFARRGMLDVSILRIGGTEAAYMIGVAERGVYYDVAVSYDDALTPLAPGFRLMQELLKMLPSFGVRKLVSHGAHEYKRRWASRFAPGARLFLFPMRPRAALSRFLKFRVAPVLGRTDPVWD